jgi:hypothetical protein
LSAKINSSLNGVFSEVRISEENYVKPSDSMGFARQNTILVQKLKNQEMRSEI